LICNYEPINSSISNLSNARDIIFKHFILNDCNINKLVSNLYTINKNNNTILYYIPNNFEIIYELTKEIYKEKNNINNFIPNNLLMRKPDILNLNKYLISNDIIKKHNIDMFNKWLNKLYVKFRDFKNDMMIYETINIKQKVETSDNDGWIEVCNKSKNHRILQLLI